MNPGPRKADEIERDRTRQSFESFPCIPSHPCTSYLTCLRACCFNPSTSCRVNPSPNKLKVGPVDTSYGGLIQLWHVCLPVLQLLKPHRSAITCSPRAGVTTSRAEQSWPPSARAATRRAFMMPASSYYNTHRILGSLIVPDLSLLEGVLLVANKQDLQTAEELLVRLSREGGVNQRLAVLYADRLKTVNQLLRNKYNVRSTW